MSPSRQNPDPTPPGRRPRVAGLRKPGQDQRPSPSPRPSGSEREPDEAEESPQPQESVGAPDAAQTPEAADSVPGDSGEGAAGTPEEADEDAYEDAPSDAAAETEQDPAARPSPRPKSRSAGTDKPAAEDEVPEQAAPGTPPARLSAARGSGKKKRSLSRRASYILAAALLVVAGVFTTGAVFFKVQHGEVAEATDNAALIDVDKTQQVKKAMKQAAERLFSYDHRDMGKTEDAAKELLATKEVQNTYSTLMDEVKRLAPKQEIVVSVTATEAAVESLEGDNARVMVYVDQSSTRAETDQPATGGAALWFQAHLEGDKWKVTGLDTYSSGDPMNSGKQQGSGNSPAPKPSGNSPAPGSGQQSSPPPPEGN